MRIEEYPRPKNDTGVGFHYFPDAAHTGREDVDRWAPRLEELGASWLVIQTPPTRPVPDSFLQRVMMADIEPVVMIGPEHSPAYASGGEIGPMDLEALQGTLRSMADSGVHYIVLYDRPNERHKWAPQEWTKPGLVERFVDCLAPALEIVTAEEMIPVLPPLEPFGAYWDTAFLQSMLKSLQRRGLGSVLDRAAVGMRNFANNRHLDWGKGGRQAWPGARPYSEPGDGQDHRGFRLYEWYDVIIREEVGHSLPLIACANGPQPSRIEGHGLDPEAHAQQAVEMARLMMVGELLPVVMNHAFWLLASERSQPCHKESWFQADGTVRLPAVEALAQLHRELRPATPLAEPVAPVQRSPSAGHGTTRPTPAKREPNGHKPIDHYLLLPVFEWGVSRWHLSVVQEYVEAFLPTCGFSVEDARLARRVTIIGNEQGVSAEASRQLEAAGCQVERIAGSTGEETERLLKQLARNKQQHR